VRLRLGVVFWLLSWIPYGILFEITSWWLIAVWTTEICLGIVGIALAGSEFSRAVKLKGWRGAPGVAWQSLRTGESVEIEDPAPTGPDPVTGTSP
jgi:hypothetical protein